MIFEKLVGIESLWKLSILRSLLFSLIQLLGPLPRILLQASGWHDAEQVHAYIASNSNNVQHAVVSVLLVDGDAQFRLLGEHEAPMYSRLIINNQTTFRLSCSCCCCGCRLRCCCRCSIAVLTKKKKCHLCYFIDHIFLLDNLHLLNHLVH